MLVSVANCRYIDDMPRSPQVGIRFLREAHGLTVGQLVERIKEQGYEGNLHPDTIRNVELGHKRASKPLMTLWAKALNLTALDVWQPPQDQVNAA